MGSGILVVPGEPATGFGDTVTVTGGGDGDPEPLEPVGVPVPVPPLALPVGFAVPGLVPV